MNLKILRPKRALNKAYLKVKPHRNEIEQFKNHLITLLNRINEAETEEFHKNLVIDFLNSTYYKPDYFINTKGRNDLVIHNGKSAKSTVGVVVEAKSPSNRYEMITCENLNRKAFQELVLYYLRERITHKNIEIKHLIATNIYEWFIFDVQIFDRLFAQNKSLVKQFQDFEAGRLAETKTDFFYSEIASPFISQIQAEIPFTHFDFRSYAPLLNGAGNVSDKQLIALFKLLSPEHLLKLPFTNDSNSLDKQFYNELLHIIGLEEHKKGSKKLINRVRSKDRDPASLLENCIGQLEGYGSLSDLKNPKQHGATSEERLFNVALELVITWMNRILFLKLLEGQLIDFHQGDENYKFLHSGLIADFGDLDKLFFQVLAKKLPNRSVALQKKYVRIPYLNSSLFERSLIERETGLVINNLDDGRELSIYSGTVLKDTRGRRLHGKMDALKYLFAFLNAYDFSSEGSEEIQEENKTLINASVLGLIFEKINGYKDGSFFTPGFITMYMAHETVRKAVLQKFNTTKRWDCKDLDDVYNKIEDLKEANEIVNSLRICDPAVGSGHFLVSVLNELIALKSDLNILCDRSGRRLKEYRVEVVNDELIITDEDSELFDYNPRQPGSQRVQETLFHEKQTIIENCLFGVDINPNSVKICRLRLWIELLKNAYYHEEEMNWEGFSYRELETLPNIDINIKCGNSLISRFDLDSDLKKALKKSKWNIDSYRIAVASYRNAENKAHKREMEQLIATIKTDFRSEISRNDPKVKRLHDLSGKLFGLTQQQSLFEMTPKQKAAWNKKVQKLTRQTKKLEAEIEKIKSNKIYENAFEWRFEFPEVLNDDGDFIGFDAVIANPPYIRQEEIKEFKDYLKANYSTFKSTADLYVYFVEKGLSIIADKGRFTYILPNKWFKSNYGFELRKWIKDFKINSIIDFDDLPVFEEATTYPSILSVTKEQNNKNLIQNAEVETLNFTEPLSSYLTKRFFEVEQDFLDDSGWSLINRKTQKIIGKINNKSILLKEFEIEIFRGIVTGLNEAFIINELTKKSLIEKDEKSAKIIKPILKGRNIKRYQSPQANEFLILTTRNIDIENYPAIFVYLTQFKEKLEKKAGTSKWYELQASPRDTEKFEKPKIMYPDISKNMNFILDSGQYSVNTVYNIGSDSLGLLGFLNSKLFHFYYRTISNSIRGGYMRFFTDYMKTVPIPRGINKLENRVAEIISLKKENSEADTTALESEIDQMVYELYGLNEEEIEVIKNV